MNAKLLSSFIRLLNRIVRSGLATALAVSGLQAQTTVHLRSQAREVDFSQASTTKPAKTGNTLPPSCSVGELFLHMGQAPGKNLFVCTSVNTWTAHSAHVDIPSPPGQNQMMLTSSSDGTLVWNAFQGDVQGGLTEIKVRAIQGHGIAPSIPVSDDVLKWDDAAKAWTPSPNIPSIQQGTGISVFGNQVHVDSLLVPTYSSGTSAPTGQCTAGRDLYVDAIDNALYYCSGSGWSRVATPNDITDAFSSTATSFAPFDHAHQASGIHGVVQASQGGLGVNSDSFSGVLRMSAGQASVVPGVSNHCVLVDGTSAPCSNGATGNVRTDQGNTYTSGGQNFSGAGSLRLPAATPATPGGGDLWYESTTGRLNYYDQSGSANRSIAFVPSAGIVASNDSVLTSRTILGVPNKIDVINGDGISGNPTFTAGADIVDKTKATMYVAGAKQTFTAAANTAGFRIAPTAAPGSPEDGDVYFDSTTKRKCIFDATSQTWRCELYQPAGTGLVTSTGSAIAVNSSPALCSPGTYARGVDANGDAAGCAADSTSSGIGAILYANNTTWAFNATRYQSPFTTAGVVSSDTAGNPTTFKSPFTGKLTQLRVTCTVAPAGAALVYTIRVAQADSTLTCAVADGAMTCDDQVNQPTVTAGQQISIKGSMTGGTTGGTCGSTFALIP